MDMRTLLLERVCLLGFCTLLMVVNVWDYAGRRGMWWFASSNVNYLIGGILIANRERLPSWAAVVLANLLYSVGYVFLHRALLAFLNRNRPLWRAQCGVAVLSLVQCIYFTLIHPDIRLRLASIGLATGAQFTICAWTAFHGARVRIRGAAITMGAVCAFSALLNFARVILTLVWGTTQTYLHADDIQTTVVMLNTMIFIAVDIAFLWMIAATLSKELHAQAMTDPLTGILNRRALDVRMPAVMERSRRSVQPLSAVVIDLDRFKHVNDSMGHSVGDITLMRTARCLESELRPTDLIARMGGDEFAIVLPNCPRKQAIEIAERLRSTLESQTIAADGKAVQILASFGVATLGDDLASWEDLLAECDRALYAAKNSGGNFVHVM